MSGICRAKCAALLASLGACATFLGGCGALAGACAVLAIGLPDVNGAWALRHDTPDLWEPLGRTCNVTFVRKCWEATSNDSSTGVLACVAVFTPRFTTNDSALIHVGLGERVEESGGACGRSCSRVDALETPSGEFRTGRAYDCWRPTAAPDPRYQCGDVTCTKIGRDPNKIRTDMIANAWRTIGISAFLALLALAACCAFSCMGQCLKRRGEAVAAALGTATPTINVISSTKKDAVGAAARRGGDSRV